MKDSAEPQSNSESTPPVLSSKQRSKPEQASKSYVIGYVIACLFFDLIAFPFWELCIAGAKVRFIMDGSAATILGCVAGQMGFVAILAGLGSIRWIRGFALACILTLVAYAMWLGSVTAYSWANQSYMRDDVDHHVADMSGPSLVVLPWNSICGAASRHRLALNDAYDGSREGSFFHQ